MRKNKNLVLVVASLFLATLWGCGSNMDSGGDQTGPGTEIADAAKLGSSSCKVCHTTVAVTENFNGSAHDNDAVAGCEGCHGGGQYHKGVGPIPVPAPKVEVCVTCHSGANVAHGGTLTECLGCHDPHSLATPFASITPDAQGFVGSDTCKQCHASIHNEWKDSWHTLKANKGPALLNGSLENINPWVQANWSTLKTYQILGRKYNNSAKNYVEMWVSTDKKPISDVAVVIGQTRKQRYGVYYDGSAQTAKVVYSNNGGITFREKMIDDPQNPGTLIWEEVAMPAQPDRAGYMFLWVEVQLDQGAATDNPKHNGNNYEEWRSWQERCIDCHTTGFDRVAYNASKAAYKAAFIANGNTPPVGMDQRELFITEWAVSCESCHGPGANHAIVSPAKLAKTDPVRKQVCNQCHTRTNNNMLDTAVANDKRGFIIGGTKPIAEVMNYTRPAWGDGNRQVSMDGKGRRDHQQDQDIMLSKYILEEIKAAAYSYHGNQACFDCHTSHRVGIVNGSSVFKNNILAGTYNQVGLKTLATDDGVRSLLRLKDTRDNLCTPCHVGPAPAGVLPAGVTAPQYASVTALLNVFNAGTPAYGFNFDINLAPYNGDADALVANTAANWATEGGRGSKKSHIFNTDVASATTNKAYGLAPSQYIWSTSNTASTVKADFKAIWPWERTLEVAAGKTIVIGATPWIK